MKLSRPFAFALALAAATGLAPVRSAAQAAPVATVQGLCDALISAMEQGPALGFSGRKQLLEPQIRKALNLPFMTRIVIGPTWRTLAPEEQKQLVDAFGDYSISTYANQFSGYSGEKFIVDPATTASNGDVIVHTKLVTKDPEPVRLDYLMRVSDGTWKVIDVYLNGTISQMAARRSEYSSVLRQGGVSALVLLLKKKTSELSG